MQGSLDAMTTGSQEGAAWLAFLRVFGVSGAAILIALSGFVLLFDPYGIRAGPGRPPSPLMDLNQRYMYPQLVRGGGFEGAIFGTSTMRLIEPQAFGEAFGARIANLGMNAGTPWEQTQLADLFLRLVPAPKLVVFGLDRTWCAPDADAPSSRVTFRAFPPWLYTDHPAAGWTELLNLKSLEIAGRVALHRIGMMRERIRSDGYEVFTPPEASYDLGRAREHIWRGDPDRTRPQWPAVALDPGERDALQFPALAWLDGLVRRLPATTELLLVFPPNHVAEQARPGSREAAIEAECKARIAEIGTRERSVTVDFRFPSRLTREDGNYWDPLHYRVPVAAQVAADLRSAARTGRDAPGGTYRILHRPTGS